MSDLVSRKEAIEGVKELFSMGDCYCDELSIVGMLNSIPSAEKKGKWVKAGCYFTPGGDPVWKCSECGKGIHVYGIEAPSYNTNYADGQWVACPNCGAIMEDI